MKNKYILEVEEIEKELVKPVYNAPQTEDLPEDREYWMQHIDSVGLPNKCPHCGCDKDLGVNKDTVGAHVLIYGLEKEGLYLTPTCRGCNGWHNTDCFIVENKYLLKIDTPKWYMEMINSAIKEANRTQKSVYNVLYPDGKIVTPRQEKKEDE